MSILYRGGYLRRRAAIMSKSGGGGEVNPPNNQIWYKSSDGQVIPVSLSGLISNEYTDKGIITCSGDITDIGTAFRSNKKITELYLPNTITSLTNNALSDSTLTKIVFPSFIETLGQWMCENCNSLVSIYNYHNVRTIRRNAFLNCDLNVELNLPNLETLEGAALCYSGIRKIKNLGVITSIPNDCLKENPLMTEMRLPATLQTIGGWNFEHNYALTTIYCYATTPPTFPSGYAWSGAPQFEHIYVPAASVNAYKAANYWSDYASVISAIPE